MNNSAIHSGGAYFASSSNLIINSLVVSNNQANDRCGGMAIEKSENVIFNQFIVKNKY